MSKTHPLRLINEHIDFSFITPLLGHQYSIDYGRLAYSPEVMFKLLFLKILYHLSDERVIQEAQVNMAYKYFLNLEPDDQLMHPSSLIKFRKLRLNQEAILEELLLEMVSQAIEKGLIKSKTLILDATHIKSKYSIQTPIEMLRDVSKNRRKQLYHYVPQIKDSVPKKLHSTASLEDKSKYSIQTPIEMLRDVSKNRRKQLYHYVPQIKDSVPKKLHSTASLEEVAYTQELIHFAYDYTGENPSRKKATEKALTVLKDDAYQRILSVSDQEAKMGYKSSSESFAGYKSHLAITEERVITAIEVTTGEVSDGKYLTTLVEKSKNNAIEVKEILADAAYSSQENLE